MEPLPELPRVVQLPDGTYVYADQSALAVPQPGPQVVHQHIHHAPPDRTVQRIALGSGVGAGTVAASVYFGPLLIAAITSMAVSLAVVAFVVAVSVWGVVTVIRSVGGPEGTAAAKNLSKTRRRSR